MVKTPVWGGYSSREDAPERRADAPELEDAAARNVDRSP